MKILITITILLTTSYNAVAQKFKIAELCLMLGNGQTYFEKQVTKSGYRFDSVDKEFEGQATYRYSYKQKGDNKNNWKISWVYRYPEEGEELPPGSINYITTDIAEHLEIKKEMQKPGFELLETKPSASGLPRTVYILNKIWKIDIYTYPYKGKTQYNIDVGRW